MMNILLGRFLSESLRVVTCPIFYWDPRPILQNGMTLKIYKIVCEIMFYLKKYLCFKDDI